MITYKIHLIRTGKTGDGTSRRYVGQSDIPLCESGAAALNELVRDYRYPKVEMVYTSPLTRCMQTAEIIYPGLYTVRAGGFVDMNLGEFEGKTFDELKDTAAFTGWLGDSVGSPPPGGEDAMSFTRRVIYAAGDIFETMMEEGTTSVAVVTHGGVIMTLLASICLPRAPIHHWAVDNGFGYTILMTPQMWMRDRAAEAFALIPEPLGGYGGGEEISFFE
ncbi:hypothetical protein FACS1894191_6110 [Clostridia bacterium]|nr:hypothetical protein FACS1894191_6110 [Clostridia bacterium]